MFNTPLSRARCNSFLAYLGVVGRINTLQVRDDDEYDVARRLITDNRVGRVGGDIVNINGAQYLNTHTVHTVPHPLVLELAEETELGAEFVKVYRKNRLTAAE